MNFTFGEFTSTVFINHEIPHIDEILDVNNNILLIADTNTFPIAEKIRGSRKVPMCILQNGEENKNWQSVQSILNAAFEAKLGRDCVFIAVGGGVIGDLAGFAASIYMRGCRFILISTTLLGMVDASVGGKTGFDLFGIKNLIGAFYPAQKIYISADSLSSLPKNELKSGMAELIKTAVLSGDEFLDELISRKEELITYNINALKPFIEKAVYYKGAVVTEDPKETTGKRAILNLGHTFAHALETVTGLGTVSHGEAVAWGIVRACELGHSLGITPKKRAQKIIDLITSFDYITESPHPKARDEDAILTAMKSDKKNKNGKFTFIVPDETSAKHVILESENDLQLLKKILTTGINL